MHKKRQEDLIHRDIYAIHIEFQIVAAIVNKRVVANRMMKVVERHLEDIGNEILKACTEGKRTKAFTPSDRVNADRIIALISAAPPKKRNSFLVVAGNPVVLIANASAGRAALPRANLPPNSLRHRCLGYRLALG